MPPSLLKIVTQWVIFLSVSTVPITVVETRHFEARAKRVLNETQRAELVNLIAGDPQCGTILGGGVRKVRFASHGRGKSGGVRVIYYFYSEAIPVFLLEIFAKNEKSNLSKAETAALVKAAKGIAQVYGRT